MLCSYWEFESFINGRIIASFVDQTLFNIRTACDSHMTLCNHHIVSHDLPQSSRAQYYNLCIGISKSIGPQSTQPTTLHHPGHEERDSQRELL